MRSRKPTNDNNKRTTTTGCRPPWCILRLIVVTWYTCYVLGLCYTCDPWSLLLNWNLPDAYSASSQFLDQCWLIFGESKKSHYLEEQLLSGFTRDVFVWKKVQIRIRYQKRQWSKLLTIFETLSPNNILTGEISRISTLFTFGWLASDDRLNIYYGAVRLLNACCLATQMKQ